MRKFEKVQIAVRIKPETKVKLEDLRIKTGMTYGTLLDMLVDSIEIEKTKYGFRIDTPVIGR